MINEVWYLLYGGQSEDGLGPGKYIGRTTDIEVAAKHLSSVRSNPYSTGYVMVITDKVCNKIST